MLLKIINFQYPTISVSIVKHRSCPYTPKFEIRQILSNYNITINCSVPLSPDAVYRTVLPDMKKPDGLPARIKIGKRQGTAVTLILT